MLERKPSPGMQQCQEIPHSAIALHWFVFRRGKLTAVIPGGEIQHLRLLGFREPETQHGACRIYIKIRRPATHDVGKDFDIAENSVGTYLDRPI